MLTETRYPYRALYELARDLHRHNLDTRKNIQTATNRAAEIVGATQGCIVTFRDESTIDDATVYGTDADNRLWESLHGQGLIGYVFYAQRVVNINNIATDPRWPVLDDLENAPEDGSAIGLPLPRGAGTCGVMLFIHPEVAYFDAAKVALLHEIAGLTTDALNNALDFRHVDDVDRRYQTLFSEAVVPMLLTDLRGNILNVNQQATELLDYDPADMLGHNVFMIHDLDLTTIRDGRGVADMHINEELTLRTTLKTRHGDEIPSVVRIRRLRVDEKDVVEWVEQDISAQMELEQLRRDLTAMVYHDLRGPLQSIRGSINKLAQVLANHDNPAVLNLLQVGIRSTRQLRRMIDSLLDVQKLEEGQAMLNLEESELRVLLADAVQLVQPIAMDAGQRLNFKLEDRLPNVPLDTDMVIRVVINLLENAIKYTPSGGTVTLGAYHRADHVYISVEDSGPGIPEDMKLKIFDKFNRVKYHDAPKGVGLGLAFCRLAVEAHHGRIWVESDEGQGSAFIFTLPLHNEAFEAMQAAASAQPEAAPDEKTDSLATTA